MIDSNHTRRAAIWVAGIMLAVSGASFATEQGQQRRAGRDATQDARQEARENKVDCRQDNEKSNAECRQDKRNTKQEGREEKRDIKY